MNELKKTNRLTIVVVAFVLVIVVGLITLRRPDVTYELSAAESLKLLNDPAISITPDQATARMKENSGKTVFVDVRNSVAYDRGHVENSVNIPVRELFGSKSKSVFRHLEKSGQVAILYGETPQQASSAWLMLKQTGFKSILRYTGSYVQLDMAHADSLTKLLPQLSETPLIDTAALKAISAPVGTDKPAVKVEKKTVAPVKKSGSSGGGC
jgi:rhodanese-related sulfurtransferase